MSSAERPIFLVDGSGFVFRAFFALQRARLTNRQGMPTGAVYAFTQMLIKLREDLKAGRLAIVFDAKGGRSFRNEIYKEYKAQRPSMPDDLARQIPYIHKVVAALRVPTLTIEGVEADDVIATVARIAGERGRELVIVAADKDLMQLVGGHVSLLDTLEDKNIGPAEVEEKWGVPPSQLGDLLALMGDSTDNIPGVEGVGPKTAARLLKDHGTLEGVLAAIDSMAPRMKDAFRRAGDTPRLARRLVALRSDVSIEPPIGEDFERFTPGDPDLDTLEALFTELDFRKLLDRFRPRLSLDRSRYQTIDDEAGLQRIAAACRAAGAFAFALVGTGRGGSGGEIAGVALAARGVRPSYVPMRHSSAGAVEPASGSQAEELDRLGELGQAALARAAGGAAAPRQLDPARALELLRPLFEDDSLPKHAYDHKPALAALHRAGIALGGVDCDPMIASFLVDASRPSHEIGELADDLLGQRPMRVEEVAGRGKAQVAFAEVALRPATEYAAERAETTLHLADRLGAQLATDPRLLALAREVEMPLARVLAMMELRGIRVDVGHLSTLGRRIERDVAAIEAEIARLVGGRVNLASPKQLAALLFVKLGLPVVKRNKTGPSTDADVLEELALHHPVAAQILEHRMLTKLQSTYVVALPPLVDPATHRVHTSFNQTGAATGRLSSTEPNLQNIPVRTDLGREIRRAFITDPGSTLVSLDYSQIELRVLAHLAEDERLVDAFHRGEDIHARTAREVFGLEAAQVTAEHRRIAKAVNFGVVYGQGDVGLAKAVGIEREKARAYIEGYFARYAGVARYMERAIAEARQKGYSETLHGRRRPLPDLHSSNGRLRAAAERMARNTPIQGTAADILKIAMVRVGDRLARGDLEAHLLLTVHDELLLECRTEQADAAEQVVREAMEEAVSLRVPLRVDAGRGPTWADAH
jgi:DNA polymerase-1